MSTVPKAGIELDVRIAREVMGLRAKHEVTSSWSAWYFGKDDWDSHYDRHPEFHYSTNVAAAWEVVSQLGLPFELNCDDEQTLWNARFNLDRGEWAQASTAPHAICLAALRVK